MVNPHELMAIDIDMEQRLRRLLDEREIHEVLLRYCRGVDRCDAQLLATCYHPDTVGDHGNWVAYGADAPDAIIERVKPGTDPAIHFLGNVGIEVEDDTAFAESYLLAFRCIQREGSSYTRTRALRFIDRFTRRGGRWRIRGRVVADDCNRVDEILEAMADAGRFRYGSKDREDPVYALRRGRVARELGGK